MINTLKPENSRKLAEIFNRFRIYSLEERNGYIDRFNSTKELEAFLSEEM
jgi:hypothetical protein